MPSSAQDPAAEPVDGPAIALDDARRDEGDDLRSPEPVGVHADGCTVAHTDDYRDGPDRPTPMGRSPRGSLTWAPSISRRHVLGGVAAGAGVALLGTGSLTGRSPGWPSGQAEAAQFEYGSVTSTSPGRLVVVFLRGGMDGLSAVAPVGEAAYHDARPTIGLPADAALPLDATFGLHPAMGPLHGLFQAGRLGFVHATGNPAGSRSHFDAQDYMEQGDDERRVDGRGWLTRHLLSSPGDVLFRAVCISSNVPGSLRGSQALSIPSLTTFGLGGRSGLTRDWGLSLRLAYHGTARVETIGTASLAAVETIGSLAGGGVPPANGYDPGAAFTDALTLLSAGLGVETITIDLGGWDTHDNMGPVAGGQMQGLLAGLAKALAGFQAGLDAKGLGDVTTVVMSEFGRRVQQNGSGGLDHGLGNVMILLGAGIAGGRVYGEWPTVSAAALDRGDLAITTDYRDVLWELVRDRLGNANPAGVFDGHVHTPVGVTR